MKGSIKNQINLDIEGILKENLPWHKLNGARILITGANGFVGQYLLRTLLRLNQIEKLEEPLQVIAMVRDKEKSGENFSDIQFDKFIKIIEWDLNKILSIPKQNIDFIFHLASKASPKFYKSDPVGTILPNTVGTAALLELLSNSNSKKTSKGLVFVSSSEVYGESIFNLNQKSLTENIDFIVNPKSNHYCYSESKRLGEALCRSWTKQYGIPTYSARLFHTYGPGLNRNDGRVFADFIFNILNNENVKILGSGKTKRSFCYVSDSIKALLTILLKGEASESYNIGNPNAELSIFNLAKLLVDIYPEKNLTVIFENKEINLLKNEFNVLKPNIDKLKNLGWYPRVQPIRGFKQTIDCHF